MNQQIDLRNILKNNFSDAELTDFGNTSLNFPTSNRDIETESVNSEKNSIASSTRDIHEIFQDFQNIPTTVDNMAQMTGLDFMNLASRAINNNYDGNPLSLESFINSVELLSDICHDAIKETFFRIVKSKLEGRAVECRKGAPNVTTVDHIIETTALKAQIKPNNSKVIAGRMLALFLNRQNN